MAPAGFGDRVEGFHAVLAAAAAHRVEEMWVETSRARRPEFEALIRLVQGQGAVVRVVHDVADLAATSSPQGVVARARPIASRTVEGLLSTERPALMVLDHVIDPHNLGAVARSALAAGLSGLIVSGRRAAPFSAVAFKSAAGAFEKLPIAIVNSIADSMSRLKKADVWTVGLAGGSATALFGLGLLSEPVALVIGQEGGGLSRLVAERCDVIASIPMAPGTESLNVSVAAGIAAYEVMRVRAS
jgi:23S rRNA (guanosine2251-2'-O)-methyltransferase